MQLQRKRKLSAERKLSGEQVTVETTENESATYIGLSEGPFKLKYANHRSSFKNKEKANQTELSKHIWQLTNKNIKHNISRKILRKAKPYNTITKRCNLCLWECFFILYKPNMCTLNKRNKLLSTCATTKPRNSVAYLYFKYYSK